MYIRKYIISFFFLSVQFVVFGQSSLFFSENRNQWNSSVLFRSSLYEGYLYIEQDGLKYQFFDPKTTDTEHAHGPYMRPEPEELLALFDDSASAAYADSLHTPMLPHTVVSHTYKVFFHDMNPRCYVTGHNVQEGIENYYIGNDPAKWGQGVRTFQGVQYHELYKNIDLLLYDNAGGLKYDFIIKPKGNPKKIELRYAGVKTMEITQQGNLLISTSVNQVLEYKPYAFQIINNDTIEIPCSYDLSYFTIRYNVGKYNKSHTLYIDPDLIFSTYSGSNADNWGFTATYDYENNAYGGGIVSETGYPVSLGAAQTTYNGGSWDVGIIKYNPEGTMRLYATYLGGSSAEMPHSLIVNKNNELLVLGTTSSPDFPTKNAYQSTFQGGKPIVYNYAQNFENGIDIFITKLSSDGSQILASTFMGGTQNDGINYDGEEDLYYGQDSLYYNYADGARGEIMLDKDDNIYVATTTFSSDFPVLNAAQPVSNGSQEAVIFKFNPELTDLQWSTYFGGESKDAAYSVDIDTSGSVFVSGGTCSQTLPSLPSGGFISSRIGGTVDAFVLRVNSETGAFEHGSLFGSPAYDQAHFVRVNESGDVFLFGQTTASGSTLIYNAPYNTPNSGQFLASFSNDLSSLHWSTVFGTGIGRPNITPTAFEVDICNRIYLAGSGRDWQGPALGWYFDANKGYYMYDLGWSSVQGTKNMDITPDAFQKVTDGQDFYLLVIDDKVESLNYATFFGEQAGYYYTYDGYTLLENGCGSGGRDHVDGGTSRFDSKGYIYQSVCASCGGCNDFPIKPNPGAWSVTNNSSNCNNAVLRFFIDFGMLIADFELPELACETFELTFTNTTRTIYDDSQLSYTWDFGDGTPFSHEESPKHIYTSEGEYTVILWVEDMSACNQRDSISKKITVVTDVRVDTLPNQNICEGESVEIGISQEYNPNFTYQWVPATGLDRTDRPQAIATPSETTEYTLMVTEGGWCRTEYIQKVQVHKNDYAIVRIEVEANNQQKNPVCNGDMVTLRAITNNETARYVWSENPWFSPVLNADFTNDFIQVVASNPQRYYVQAFSTYCSFDDTSSVYLDVSYNSIHAYGDTLICKDDYVSLSVENLTPGKHVEYTWQPSAFVKLGQGTENVVVSPPQTTNFIVFAQNEDGCVAQDTVTVEVDEMIIDTYFFDQISCYGEADGRIFVSPIGIPEYTYIWENGHDGPSRDKLEAGTYTVTIVDSLGCTNTRDFEIIEPQPFRIVDTTLFFATCSTACNGSAYVEVAGGTQPYLYQWSNGDTTAHIQNLCQQSYSLHVIDAHGCEVSLNQPIVIGLNERLPLLEAYADSYSLYKGQSTNIYAASVISDTISYHWSPSLWLSDNSQGIVTATPDESITYYVTATDSYGCMSLDTVTISVHDWNCGYPYIYVPTAFSPNNDMVNDVLQVQSGIITDVLFEVYDRWGECVFSTTDISTTWDGTYRGKPLQPQVLVYYIKATCLNSEEFVEEGNITIIK